MKFYRGRPIRVAMACSLAFALSGCGGDSIPISVSVGGTVTGLAGTGLVLQNNLGNDLPIAANGSFVFPTKLTSGQSYNVTIKAQPRLGAVQCQVSGGSGVAVAQAVTSVAIDCAPPTPSLLLVSRATSNSVEILRIDSGTGSLQHLSSKSLAAGATPVYVAVGPSMQFAYVANVGDKSIAIFQVDEAAGTLTEVGVPVTTADAPDFISFDPTGRFAYVSHSGVGKVSVFQVDATTGALTPTTGSPFSTGLGSRSLQVAPSGTVAYAMSSTGINVYSVDPATGALASASSVTTAGGSPSVAIDPGNRYVYAPYYDISWSIPDDIGAFAVTDAASGALTPISGSPFATDAGGANWAAVDPTGRYLYVVGYSLNVASHAIDPATGALTPLSTNVSDSSPSYVLVDPSGRYVYVANDHGSLSAYSIGVSGALTPVGAPLHLPAYGPYGSMSIALVTQ